MRRTSPWPFIGAYLLLLAAIAFTGSYVWRLRAELERTKAERDAARSYVGTGVVTSVRR